MSEAKNTQAPKVATGDRAILPEGAGTIPVYVMGKRYQVPETLTIMKAMEFAGFKFIRGAGCRGGRGAPQGAAPTRTDACRSDHRRTEGLVLPPVRARTGQHRRRVDAALPGHATHAEHHQGSRAPGEADHDPA